MCQRKYLHVWDVHLFQTVWGWKSSVLPAAHSFCGCSRSCFACGCCSGTHRRNTTIHTEDTHTHTHKINAINHLCAAYNVLNFIKNKSEIYLEITGWLTIATVQACDTKCSNMIYHTSLCNLCNCLRVKQENFHFYRTSWTTQTDARSTHTPTATWMHVV